MTAHYEEGGGTRPRSRRPLAMACPRVCRRTIQWMSVRVRWIVFEVVLLLVIGLAALYWFNNLTDDVTIQEVDGRRTWIIQPGDTVRLSSDEVGPDDWFRCEGKGGVIGTPEPGRHTGESHGLWVETASGGTVTLYCEPGPPLSDY
jgi:hypothetical protein